MTPAGELALEAVEQDFDAVVGDARLRGRVDRLERDAAGRLVVVDLKTGTSKPAKDELPTNPQLGAYQVAVEAGGFGERGPVRWRAARPARRPDQVLRDQGQPPLSEQDDPRWIAEHIDHVAARMRGSEFSATVNPYCGDCDLKGCCPLMTEGRQVTT